MSNSLPSRPPSSTAHISALTRERITIHSPKRFTSGGLDAGFIKLNRNPVSFELPGDAAAALLKALLRKRKELDRSCNIEGKAHQRRPRKLFPRRPLALCPLLTGIQDFFE